MDQLDALLSATKTKPGQAQSSSTLNLDSLLKGGVKSTSSPYSTQPVVAAKQPQSQPTKSPQIIQPVLKSVFKSTASSVLDNMISGVKSLNKPLPKLTGGGNLVKGAAKVVSGVSKAVSPVVVKLSQEVEQYRKDNAKQKKAPVDVVKDLLVGILGERENPRILGKGGYEPKNFGEKLGVGVNRLASDTVAYGGGDAVLNQGLKLGSRSLGFIADQAALPILKKIAVLENIFSSSKITKADIADIVAGKATSAKVAQFQRLKNAGVDVAELARKNKGDVLDSIKQALADIKAVIKKQTTKGETKLLPEKTGVLTPEEARGTVINTPLENTPIGKKIIKTSLEAEKKGGTVAISPTGDVNLAGIESSVVQVKDATGNVTFKTIPQGKLDEFKKAIDDTGSGIAGKNIEGNTYHITAKTPEQMTSAGARSTGVARIEDIPGQVALKDVREAISSGDLEGAKALYDDLSKQTYLPSFESIKTGLAQDAEREAAKVANEGVKAVKESYGQYGDTVSKMKNLLRISATKKGPTGLEFQEHIPQSVFGVGSDEIATSLGMSEDEFMQKMLSELDTTKQVVPKGTQEVGVPRSQLPVGEGKERVSRLEARLTDNLKNLGQEEIDSLGLSTYKQMTQSDQIAKASEYVVNNTNEALKVLRGEIDAPPGILVNSILSAMIEHAKDNYELALKIGTLGATRTGQELNILKTVNPNSPVKVVQDVFNIVEESVKRRYGKSGTQVVKDVVKKQKSNFKAPDLADWGSLIKEIRC